jgi:hypothetical protein
MKHLSSLIFSIFVFSFISAYSQDIDCIKLYSSHDTVTKYGNFIKYRISDNQIKLEYGNKYFKDFYTDTYFCNVADVSIPWLQYDNIDFMLLLYSCGSSCSQLIMLPLNPSEKPKSFYNYLAYDDESTNLVYTDTENLVIENLKSKKSQTVNLPKCEAANIIYCLDSVSINKSILSYYFYGPWNVDGKAVLNKHTVFIK